MKKFFSLFVFFFLLSGCSFSENPDKENFNQQYYEPSFEEEEQKILNGEL